MVESSLGQPARVSTGQRPTQRAPCLSFGYIPYGFGASSSPSHRDATGLHVHCLIGLWYTISFLFWGKGGREGVGLCARAPFYVLVVAFFSSLHCGVGNQGTLIPCVALERVFFFVIVSDIDSENM
ncbi:hypothetical protein B0J18DRAFT_431029 [Chaetomium sp. MPI-SDFR-AT-0129]|nr:hypothetical protein B0J18DRAFT_431029 [Chaetomium sp. MPI-SDFR-AT-0129]